jgi:hypothetical protein
VREVEMKVSHDYLVRYPHLMRGSCDACDCYIRKNRPRDYISIRHVVGYSVSLGLFIVPGKTVCTSFLLEKGRRRSAERWIVEVKISW